MFVRTADERDLPAASRLIGDAAHSTFDALWGAAEVSRVVADWFSLGALTKFLERQRSEFLVADDGTALGGVAFGAATGDDARVVELDVLIVRPDLHGRGIGGMLLEEFEQSFFESELARVEVEARSTRAIRFFEGAGYAEIGRKDATDVQTTLLILQKSLV